MKPIPKLPELRSFVTAGFLLEFDILIAEYHCPLISLLYRCPPISLSFNIVVVHHRCRPSSLSSIIVRIHCYVIPIHAVSAMALQAQWDIGSSVFSFSGKALSLIQAATVDDVHPSSVVAAEALGSMMIVDDRLIGKAVDALGGNKSFRLESLKLQIGLSSGGIPSQIRKCTPAIKTFLLITALKQHLDAEAIGDLLYEMLLCSKSLATLPVSSSQLRGLTVVLEGHCVELLSQEKIPTTVLAPVLDAIVPNGNSHAIFAEMIPDEASEVLLAVFNAIRDGEVRHLKITGQRFGIWLVSVLGWLCPSEIAVFNNQDQLLFGNACGKISIIFRHTSESWSLEYWYEADDVSKLIEITHSSTYAQIAPQFVPREMAYSVWRNRVPPGENPSSDDLYLTGRIAVAFVIAMADNLCLFADTGLAKENPIVHKKPVPLLHILPPDFTERAADAVTSLGWPHKSDKGESTMISMVFAKLASGSQRSTSWHELVQTADNEHLGNILGTKDRTAGQFRYIVTLAVHIAHTHILHAIHRREDEFYTYPTTFGGLDPNARSWLLDALFTDTRSKLSAKQFLTCSMLAFDPRTNTRDNLEKLAKDSLLATTQGGYVAYFHGLLETPRTPQQAFEIAIQPGHLTWREVKQQYLQEQAVTPLATSSPDPACYNLNLIDMTVARPRLKVESKRKLQVSITKGSYGPSLAFAHSSLGDWNTSLLKALVNFALCPVAIPSDPSLSKNTTDMIKECFSRNIIQLKMKTPGNEDLRPNNSVKLDWEPGTRAIATYTGHEYEDFFRFGTLDASHLNCLIQGSASIPECVLQAEDLFGTDWLILSNP